MSTHLTILGGGPAGLAVAHYANPAGLPFALFEMSDRPGGLCRTERLGSHRFDTGAHRFHDQDSEITQDLKSLLGAELHTVSRPSRVWLAGRFVDFPPTPANLVLSGGLINGARIGWDLIRSRSRARSGEPVSFEEFAVRNFGRTLAEQFLLNYSAKVWGLPADQLSPQVATRRLSGMSLRTLAAELLRPGRKSAHLDGKFLYPRGGYGRIVEAIVAALPRGSIWTNREVTGLSQSGDRISTVRFADRTEVQVPDQVVWTLPLTLVVRLLGTAVFSPRVIDAARELQFRQIRLLYFRLGRPRFSDNASIYIPDPEFCLTRIYEPKNRCESMAPGNETGIAVEVPCFAGDALSRLTDKALFDRAAGELAQIGLLQPAEVLEWRHLLLRNAYPVYSVGFEDRVSVILEEASRVRNLVLQGRNGIFFYSHFHHQMRFAKDLVGRLEAAGGHAPGVELHRGKNAVQPRVG